MLALLLVVLFQFELVVGHGEAGYFKALQFGQDTNSYIRFSPDMRPFENKFSVCSWVRKVRSSSYSVWMTYYYNAYEISMSDDGVYNHIFGSNPDMRAKFSTVPQGQWFHQCSTWSLQSRTGRFYLNGVLVGTKTTSSGRTLALGQQLLIGNFSPGHSYYFGGELYQLNVYSEELSSSDVQALAGGGPCSGGEELHDDTRQLKWEEIIQQTRTGTVKEIEIDAWGCELGKDLREQKSQLNQTESRLNATLSELAQTRKEMEQELTQLNSTAHELDKTQQQLNSTAQELNKTQLQLNSTAHELEKATKQLDNMNITECLEEKSGITQWDLLYSEAFINKVFSHDLYMKLPSSWDFLEDFVGVRMTDGLINLFKDYHSMKETCTFDPEDADGET